MQLVATDIAFAYGSAPPLFTNISLKLRQGERVALVGGNAVGKTTLLKILAGQLRPLRGSVKLEESDGDVGPDTIGLVYQNPEQQMLADSVEHEIALGLELRAVPPAEIRERVERMLVQFGLQDLRKRTPQQLSGGQKQRVALAAILISRPVFLLLDEPDSYLDAPARRLLLEAIDAHAASCGILWTTPTNRNVPTVDRLLQMKKDGIESGEGERRAT